MHVVLNCAVDRHGRMAGPGGEPVRISTEGDLRRVHALRAQSDAILVGVETVLRDDPSLRVRSAYAEGPDPVPVVLDTHLRTPATARVVRAGTRIYHHAASTTLGDATLVRVPLAGKRLDLAAVLHDLETAGVQRLMVEGGPTVLQAFIEAGSWVTWTVFQADADIGDGPGLWDGLPEAQPAGVGLVSKESRDGGVLWTFSPA